jgi:excisionase family DNA binding protein
MEQTGHLMTIDDVAEYLRVKKRTVYDWVKKGKIPAMKTVGLWRFRKDRIDAWLEEEGHVNTAQTPDAGIENAENHEFSAAAAASTGA